MFRMLIMSVAKRTVVIAEIVAATLLIGSIAHADFKKEACEESSSRYNKTMPKVYGILRFTKKSCTNDRVNIYANFLDNKDANLPNLKKEVKEAFCLPAKSDEKNGWDYTDEVVTNFSNSSGNYLFSITVKKSDCNL